MGSRTIHLNAPGGEPLPRRRLEHALVETLRREGRDEGELSATFLADPAIAELNLRYLGHEGPTDVISFRLEGPGDTPLGDIYVGIEQARRQADREGVPLEEELVRLAVHGALHVLGYEHPSDPSAREASEQYRRQEEIVAWAMGLSDGAGPS